MLLVHLILIPPMEVRFRAVNSFQSRGLSGWSSYSVWNCLSTACRSDCWPDQVRGVDPENPNLCTPTSVTTSAIRSKLAHHFNASRCAVWQSTRLNYEGEGSTRRFYLLWLYDSDDNLLWTTDLVGSFEPWMPIPDPPAYALEGISPGDHELNQFETWIKYEAPEVWVSRVESQVDIWNGSTYLYV
jgi:hypothetical protein